MKPIPIPGYSQDGTRNPVPGGSGAGAGGQHTHPGSHTHGGYEPPPGYAPPPQTGYAPRPVTGYAPPPQTGYAPRPVTGGYEPRPSYPRPPKPGGSYGTPPQAPPEYGNYGTGPEKPQPPEYSPAYTPKSPYEARDPYAPKPPTYGKRPPGEPGYPPRRPKPDPEGYGDDYGPAKGQPRPAPGGQYPAKPEPPVKPEPKYPSQPESGYPRKPESGYAGKPEPGYPRKPEPEYPRTPEPGYPPAPEPDYPPPPEQEYQQQPRPGGYRPPPYPAPDPGGEHTPHGDHPTHDYVEPEEPSGYEGQGGELPAQGTAVVARQNQKNLTPDARRKLLGRIRDYIRSPEDPVGYHRTNGHVHGTPDFLPWHRAFLQRFEEWQLTRLRNASDFIPLAFWDPNDPMPMEYRRENHNASIPAMPLPPELSMGGGLEGLGYDAFSQLLEAHHNEAHDLIGGDMVDTRVSPSDPIFWLLHAFYDHVFATWQQWQGEAAMSAR